MKVKNLVPAIARNRKNNERSFVQDNYVAYYWNIMLVCSFRILFYTEVKS